MAGTNGSGAADVADKYTILHRTISPVVLYYYYRTTFRQHVLSRW